MKIATWNVNSVKARLPTVLEVLKAIDCDVVCLQELKCETDAFPYMEVEDLGWTCAVQGQKSYNGVALLSKYPLEDIQAGLPGNENDDQARYIEALVMAEAPIRVGGLYLPNGNPAPGDKYNYKLAWIERLKKRARELLATEEPFVLAGDYNCILDNRAHQYTFWDYQGGAFPKDHGIRIDHILCSPQATDRLETISIYKPARALDKPSDHVPVIGTFR